MAKKKVAARSVPSSSIPPLPEIPKGANLILEKQIIPIVGIFGRSVEITYRKEFDIIDTMQEKQSVAFEKKKKNIIDAIRTRIQKISPKRFIMKKVDDNYYRMWRVEDGAKINQGGRIAGVSPYKKAGKKAKNVQEVNTNGSNQNVNQS